MGQSVNQITEEQLIGLYSILVGAGAENGQQLDKFDFGHIRQQYNKELDKALDSPEVKAKLDEARGLSADAQIPSKQISSKQIDEQFDTLKKELPGMVEDRMAATIKVVFEEIEKRDPDLARSLEKERPDVAEKIKNFEIPEGNRAEIMEGINEYLNSDEADVGKLIEKEASRTVNEALDGFEDRVSDKLNRKLDSIEAELPVKYDQAVMSMAQTLYDACIEDGQFKANNGQASLDAAAKGLRNNGEFGQNVVDALNDKLRVDGLNPLSSSGVEPGSAPIGMAP